MTEQEKQVREFMQKAGQEVPAKPTMPSENIIALRQSLIVEEASELADATTIVEAADAIGDLLYVVLGAAVAYGIDLEPIFEEIHRSNMSKFIDGHRREDGKWVKGPSYSPANLGPIIEVQGMAEAYEVAAKELEAKSEVSV